MNAPIKKPIAIGTLSIEAPAESPRRFVIQDVYDDMLVVQRTAGTFASLLEAYECIVDNVAEANGMIKSLHANPQLGVACVKIRVYRTDHTYLITPDEMDYIPSRFIPTIRRHHS